MNAMSLSKSKNKEYPDATPAIHMALAQARKQCQESAQSIAEKIGADEEGQEALSSMCLKNVAAISPLLN